jgi:hypothetical protein
VAGQPIGLQHNAKGNNMSRNALIASLAGAIALGMSALSAQAASVPMGNAGINSGLVQKAHYRYYRHHHHRYYGYGYGYYRHHHHPYYYRHHHHRYW